MGSFAKGLAAALNSYMDTKEDYRKQAIQKEDAAWQKESRDFERTNREEQRKRAAEIEAERKRMIEAGRQVPVQKIVTAPTDGMDAAQQQALAEKLSFGEAGTTGYEVDGKTYADNDLAKQAAEAKRVSNVSNAMKSNGQFAQAVQLEATLEKQRHDKLEMARKLKNENMFDAVRFASQGNAKAFRSAFDSGGDEVMVDDPVLTKRVQDVDGVGKRISYDYAITTRDKAGNIYKRTVNSDELNKSLLPYEKLLDLDMKLYENKSQADLREHQKKIAAAGLGLRQAAVSTRTEQPFDLSQGFNMQKEYERRLSDLHKFNDENGKPMTTAQLAQKAWSDVTTSKQTVIDYNTQAMMDKTIKANLDALKSDPGKYNSARNQLLERGFSAQHLKTLGH